MAFNARAAAAYQNNSIQTASPADLTLMLYEGAIKFCNMALDGLEKNDKEKANNNIIKAEKIKMAAVIKMSIGAWVATITTTPTTVSKADTILNNGSTIPFKPPEYQVMPFFASSI